MFVDLIFDLKHSQQTFFLFFLNFTHRLQHPHQTCRMSIEQTWRSTQERKSLEQTNQRHTFTF